MKRIPLIPIAETRHFQIGSPSNPIEGFRYDGSDPYISFPHGWHCQVNNGGIQGISGGYEQHPDTLHDAAHRIQVIQEGARNVIQLPGGLPDQPGGAMLAHPFRAVEWGTGESISFETTLKFLSVPASERYFIQELRGFLNFRARKNESVEGASWWVTENIIGISWYRDAKDGDGVEKKFIYKANRTLEYDQYHRFTMTLAPLAARDTWQASFKIRSEQEVVWDYTSDETNHPNNLRAVDMMVLGDEQARNFSGGRTLIARAAVYAITK